MSFECYREYEAIYLKTSSLDPQKDASSQQMALLSPGQWLPVGPKLMGREIILCVSYCSKPGGGLWRWHGEGVRKKQNHTMGRGPAGAWAVTPAGLTTRSPLPEPAFLWCKEQNYRGQTRSGMGFQLLLATPRDLGQVTSAL